MTLMSDAVEHRRLRAPKDNGGQLIEPPLSTVAALVERNRATATEADYDLQGRSLAELSAQARRELVSAALTYTRRYRDVPNYDGAASERVFLAGHQPQLFHPGVWFKNFVLSKLAREHAAVAVNLAIDSDTIKTASIRTPGGTVDEPHVESLPLDRPSAEIPYEERAIVDDHCLHSFGERVAKVIGSLVADPLVREFWPKVIERSRHVRNLGEVIAQARHQQEGAWGGTTLELPQSHVCSLPAFHWFAAHLLANLPRLWEAYNRSVADYRRANRIRSTAHPVPDLSLDDGWLEAPFWIWSADNMRRRRLFVRCVGDALVLSDRQSIERRLSLSADGDASRGAEQLAQLAAEGVRLRTRALITTLFARVFLGDLFLHGIGGAKYDQVTDAIIERFFGIAPPQYMTLTATLRLPIERRVVTVADARSVDAQLRELKYHPERYLGASADGAAEIVATKQRWIETVPTIETARERARAIESANLALQPWVAQRTAALINEREPLTKALRDEQLLGSREYAFCLYPADDLQRLMQVRDQG